jgi:hypothetical protein
MRRRSILCTLTAAAAAAALTCTAPATAAQPRVAAACSGSDTWTSLAGDTLWTSGGNWSTNSPPSAAEVAVLPTATADNVDLNTDASICELDMAPASSLLIEAGKTLSAANLVNLTGGPAANAYTSLTGQITTADLHVQDGYTDVSEADSNTPVTESTTTFELDAGAHLLLSDSALTLKVSGLASLGGTGTTHLDSNGTADSDDSAKFDVDTNAHLAGTLDSDGLDVITTPNTVIDTAGHTWTVHGDAFSRFAGGTKIESSAAGGVYAIGNQDHVLVSGPITVAPDTTLNLKGTGLLTDGRYFKKSGAPLATVGGHGTFAWTGGQITGHVNLSPSLTTVASGSGDRDVSDPTFGDSVLTNAGSFTLTDGSVIVDDSKDTFVNTGKVDVTGGHFGANSSDAPAIRNESGAHWTVEPSGATSSKITDGSFRNAGVLTIAAKTTLLVGNTFRQVSSGSTSFTVSSSTKASRMHAGALSLAGKAHVSSASGYAPKHSTVTGLLHGGSRSGTFSHIESTTHRRNTGWHLKYHGGRVDAVLS